MSQYAFADVITDRGVYRIHWAYDYPVDGALVEHRRLGRDPFRPYGAFPTLEDARRHCMGVRT